MNKDSSVPRFSWADVWARRLERHALATPMPNMEPADVARAICGVHAQIMSAAELSIGLRLTDATRADIRAALWREHSLVKTFGPRGTVHLLPLHDLPLWIDALSALPSTPSPFAPSVQLTPEQTDMVVAAIATALENAELTIDELTTAVVASCGAWAGDLVMPAFGGLWPRWRQAVDTAAQRGVLCFGPNRGRNVTYTSPRRWLPGFQPADGQAALAELLRRYLHAYGPATPAQFAQWLAAPQQWAGELFAALGDALREVAIADTRAWVLAADAGAPSTQPRGLHLLPYFDAYVVGCHPRDQLFPGRAAARALANGQAGNYPVLLIDGVVAGVWHLRRAGRTLAIAVEPLEPLTKAQQRSLADQVERVGAILEGAPQLRIGAVTVGPHA